MQNFNEFLNNKKDIKTLEVTCSGKAGTTIKEIFKILKANKEKLNIVLDPKSDKEQIIEVDGNDINRVGLEEVVKIESQNISKIKEVVNAIKFLSNPGHSFSIEVGGKKFDMDGDGSDRIVNIK
jgi:hypothetical protein